MKLDWNPPVGASDSIKKFIEKVLSVIEWEEFFLEGEWMLKDEVNRKVEPDWIQLMKEARDIGLSKEAVREFLQKEKGVNNEQFKK